MMTLNSVEIIDGNRITDTLSSQTLPVTVSSNQEDFQSIRQLVNSTEGPLAIFTPCSNSHPFEERRILVSRSEEQAIKIGRAVVRFQPTANNAMFDCKVFFA